MSVYKAHVIREVLRDGQDFNVVDIEPKPPVLESYMREICDAKVVPALPIITHTVPKIKYITAFLILLTV